MRFRRKRRAVEDNAPGEDSFLDIVANLVGILIILVVVVAANAGTRIQQKAISEVDQRELTELEQQYDSAKREAQNMQADNRSMVEQIQKEAKLAELRKRERDQLLLRIEQAKSELARRQNKLSEQHQEIMGQANQLAVLQKKFREVDSQYTSLESTAIDRQTIEHYPTPLAKTGVQ